MQKLTPLAGLLFTSTALTSTFLSASTLTLEPMSVTADRSLTGHTSLASVTLIDRAEIERLQPQSLAELLLQSAGIQITNQGGPANLTALFMRGTESDQVLVLVDGVRLNSATSGTTAIEHLPIEQIDRVEIVRGPRASLYGSDAIGGVIQIFTRQGSGNAPLSLYAKLTAGSYKQNDVSVGLSGDHGRFWYQLGLNHEANQGFDALKTDPFSGTPDTETDLDGYKTQSASFTLGHRFSFGQIQLNGLSTDTHNFYDGFYNESRGKQHLLGTQLRLNAAQNWQTEINLSHTSDQLDSFKDGLFQSRFDTFRDSASWLNEIKLLSQQSLSVGIDWQRDKVESNTAYTETQRDNSALFAQYQLEVGANTFQFSLRGDDNQQFGQHTTGSLGWGYRFSPQLQLSLSHGTAYKAPNFNDLYYPGASNPDLKAEVSTSSELGLRHFSPQQSWSINLYQTQVQDLIAFDIATFAPNNLQQATISGAELSWQRRMAIWLLSSGFDYTQAINDSSDAYNGKQLNRRPQQKLRLGIDRESDRYQTGLSLTAIGKTYDDLANTQQLAAYNLLEAHFSYDLDKDLLLQLKANNLLDEDYQSVYGYNQPRRSLFVSFSYQP